MSARTETLPAIVLRPGDFTRLDQLASAAEHALPDVAEYLGRELDRAKVVPTVGADVVAMGSRVVFKDDAEHVHDVILVYPEEADMEKGRLSVLTPVGAALIGLSVGQSIRWRTRNGEERTLTVLSVAEVPPSDGDGR
jgi:regulator of nucleoside diphosphate kinase